jgi:hypothetical protein
MRLPLAIIPDEVIQKYNLTDKAVDGWVYLEIRKGMYGLKQAGLLANQLLQHRLEPFGYYPERHTPGLWLHKTRPVSFTLIVDDFTVKYVGQENAHHLRNALLRHYETTTDWEAKVYSGMTLNWDYQQWTCVISMPGYVANVLKKFQHTTPKQPQDTCPSTSHPNTVQKPSTPPKMKRPSCQQNSAQPYKRSQVQSCITPERLIPLSSCPSMILDYLATHPDNSIRYHASDMILHIHSDASYLSVSHARSRLCELFYCGDKPPHADRLNGSILNAASVIKNVVASAAESEVGACFHNAQSGAPLRITLAELGHPQPATPLRTDNSTAFGILNEKNQTEEVQSHGHEIPLAYGQSTPKTI